jgi:hypothetical protein
MSSEQSISLYLETVETTLDRFWTNYTRLGGNDMEWFQRNIGPLMMLPSCATGQVTYEYKDEKGNWSKPWVVRKG